MHKKKRRAPTNGKVGRDAVRKPYPDNDPEWEALEERYSQINADMRRLVELIPSKI